jgi:phage regulator Rha-like protein
MNKLVTVSNGLPVTTTLAIAEGLEVEHASIIKLVRTHQTDLEDFGLVGFEIAPRLAGQHGGGNTEYANLNERQATLIMTYAKNTEIARTFKKRLVKTFYELAENAKQPLVPQTLPEALRLAADLADKINERDKLISIIQPHSEALHRISLSDGSLCLTDAAKTLGVQPQKVLIPFLRANKWIYNRTGCNHPVAYQDKLQQMLLEHKVTTVNRTDGSEKITEQVRVTPKGLTKLAQLLEVNA